VAFTGRASAGMTLTLQHLPCRLFLAIEKFMLLEEFSYIIGIVLNNSRLKGLTG